MVNEEDYSYALGRGGGTRKKLARASGAILEYIGRFAYIAGRQRHATMFVFREQVATRPCPSISKMVVCAENGQYAIGRYRQTVNRQRALLTWCDRDDVEQVDVPMDCVAYVTGQRGQALRRMEEQTGTFMFLDGTR